MSKAGVVLFVREKRMKSELASIFEKSVSPILHDRALENSYKQRFIRIVLDTLTKPPYNWADPSESDLVLHPLVFEVYQNWALTKKKK